MKLLKYIHFMLIPCLVMSSILFTSCEQNEDGTPLESPDGAPSINYIRLSDPAKSDSLIATATLGTGVVIIGNNLGGTREIIFNDRKAMVNPSWVTNKSIFVDIPSNAPIVVSDMLYLIGSNKDTLKYSFVVSIPPPVVYSAKNEWPIEGENLVINGNYFFAPMTVTFSGGVEGEVKSVSQNQVEVTVPEGATEGPVSVSTNFGQDVSTFHLWDNRNIILDFDELLPNGWRIGMRETDDNAVNGNYNVFRGALAANQRDEGPGAPAASPFTLEYWGGNDPNRFENFYPLYPNSYLDYVLKFEAKVNKWYGGFLNITFSTPDHAGNNQEIWSNSLNARAIWGPWSVNNEEFDTDGGWITVEIPLSEFQYHMGQSDARGVYYDGGQPFIETAAGSISFWLLGSPQNDGNEVEFFIDNVRIVPAQ